MPAAARSAPAFSRAKPARRRSGAAAPPRVRVVATPLPETEPSRNPARVTARPAPRAELPPENEAKDRSRKNCAAPEASRIAP